MLVSTSFLILLGAIDGVGRKIRGENDAPQGFHAPTLFIADGAMLTSTLYRPQAPCKALPLLGP
jgi:hypothetical protein